MSYWLPFTPVAMLGSYSARDTSHLLPLIPLARLSPSAPKRHLYAQSRQSFQAKAGAQIREATLGCGRVYGKDRIELVP